MFWSVFISVGYHENQGHVAENNWAVSTQVRCVGFWQLHDWVFQDSFKRIMGGRPNVLSFVLLEYITCARTSVYTKDVSFEEIRLSLCTNLIHHYIHNRGIPFQLQASTSYLVKFGCFSGFTAPPPLRGALRKFFSASMVWASLLARSRIATQDAVSSIGAF